MAASRSRQGSAGDSDLILAWVIPAVAVLLAAASSVLWLAVAVDDERAGHPLPGNPFHLARTVVRDPAARPSAAGWVVAGILVAVLVIVIVFVVLRIVGRVHRGRVTVDGKARHLGRGRDLEPLTERSVTATARRLGSRTGRLPGTVLGRAVSGGQTLYASCEDTVVVMAGPRTGKSSAWAIPTVLDAPGAVVYTSNKTDDVALMRRVRPGLVFDPQGLTGQAPGFWWDPLSTVVDDTSAARLAGHFADDARNPAAGADAYFDPEGRNLLAWLLLAAAIDRRPITAVTDWLADSRDPAAVALLEDRYPRLARRLDGLLHLPDKQRGGVYGTAARMASCLTNTRVAAWITRPPAGHPRTHFDSAAFLTGAGVLYSLSREGEGSAGALVTALTVAVCEAAEALAVRSPHGRLGTPLTAVLDEAANVCRWRQLPQLYSHYGSRGIALLTFLQAPEQAEEVWGATGAGLLWSAANHRVYAGGVANERWLSGLSQLIGTYDAPTRTVGRGPGGTTTTHTTRREPILSVAELADLRRGRAVLLSSGVPATLIRSTPWWTGPHAGTLNADPTPTAPIADPDTAATGAAVAVPADPGVNRWIHPARTEGQR
jgi:type IV secretory pathway TraG/TraD family ATPase VirD4